MKILRSSIRFNRVILNLLFSHSFLVVTLFGNIIILGFSFLFFWLENEINPNINTYLDAVWWGFSTATTVGYGDIIPATSAGRVSGIILMLVGTALFATYTALFAQTILEDELFRLKLKSKKSYNKQKLEELITQRNELDKIIQANSK